MKLDITYDATTLGSAPAAFFTDVNYVAGLFDATFANDATVNIEVGYGDFPADGSSVPPLAESEQNNLVFADYSQVRQILANENAPGANTLPSTAPLAGQLVLGSAAEKALGLLGADSRLDGWVGVASNAALAADSESWSFSPSATPGSAQFYMVGALEHEFSEVMGRVSSLDTSGEYGLPDLYRYAGPGLRQSGTGDPAYFSINNGSTNLGSFDNTAIDSGDLADWAPSAGPKGNFVSVGADAFLADNPPGQINGLSATDQTLMAALGWNATPPEPSDRYKFYAPNQPLNLVVSNDGSNLPAAVAGEFNLELVTQPSGTSYPLPAGYQGVAILPGGSGAALDVLSGAMTVVDAGSGDTITLGAGATTVVGAGGDTIAGGSGSELINGLAGGMAITGGSGATLIWGAAGDAIAGSTGAGSATVIGAATNAITGGSGADLINALAGGMFVAGGSGATTVWGGAGDTISGGAGSGLFDGGLGKQQLNGGAGASVILGGAGDTISGGSGPTTVVGAAGDAIAGRGGALLVNGLAGAQQIAGGSGSTIVWGGAGDTIAGSTGRGSAIVIGAANSTIAGGSGSDLINGLAGAERITAGSGSTTVWGGSGDVIAGSTGRGSATIIGAAGSTIAGGAGSDLVNGLAGSMAITGGSGATTVWGGAGDTIAGGAGALTVDIDHPDFPGAERVGDNGTAGTTTVTGFSQPDGDRLFFPNETPAAIDNVVASAQSSGGNTLVTLPDGSTLTLVGVARIDSSFFA